MADNKYRVASYNDLIEAINNIKTTIGVATATNTGLMTDADKSKLDEIDVPALLQNINAELDVIRTDINKLIDDEIESLTTKVDDLIIENDSISKLRLGGI